MLTAGVGVQGDSLEASIWALGKRRECGLFEHHVLAGKPFEAQVWVDLRRLLGEAWRHASGYRLAAGMAAIDGGDGMTIAEV